MDWTRITHYFVGLKICGHNIFFHTLYKQEAPRATYRAPEYNVPHLLPYLGFLIGPKKTNLVEDIEILLSINFRQICVKRFQSSSK